MTKPSGYRRRRSPILRYTLLAVATLLAIAIFGAATPYALLAVGRIQPNDWTRFSNEGQAYGGIAAVIGMFAIVGVAASLILQMRESAANRVQAERNFHADLVFKALEEPELIECWGNNGMPNGDILKIKQHGYVNLIITYYYAMFEMGRWSDSVLRRLIADIFTGTPARDHWPLAREGWKEYPSDSPVHGRFMAIMDEEYRRAITNGPVIRDPRFNAPVTKTAHQPSAIRNLTIGAACGAAVAGAVAAILRKSGL